MKTVSENGSFGGVQGVHSHTSNVCGCEMTFAVYLPPQACTGKVPVLWYLSGLTCTDENAIAKVEAQGWAAREGIALIFPDTGPRGEGIANNPAFDLGQGAGCYVNATGAPGVGRTSACGTMECMNCRTCSTGSRWTARGRASPGIRWAGTAR